MPAHADEMHSIKMRTETPMLFSIQLSPIPPLALPCFSLMISSASVTRPVIRLTREPAKDSQATTSDDSPFGSRPGGRRLASYTHQSSALRINNPKNQACAAHLSPLSEPHVQPKIVSATL